MGENEKFGMELIDGEMVNIDNLSSKEAYAMVEKLDAKIAKLKEEINKELFENTEE